jgi:acetyl/propionyl-CoA carboxylase alpha subunit
MTIRKEFVTDGGTCAVSLRHVAGRRYVVHVGDAAHEIEAERLPDGRIAFTLDGVVHRAASAPFGRKLHVRVDGRTFVVEAAGARTRTGAEGGGGVVEAPMTGTIQSVAVAVGDAVEKGRTLVVLTAMKMEHKLTAGIAGRVVELRATVGATVDQGHVLVRVEAEPFA